MLPSSAAQGDEALDMQPDADPLLFDALFEASLDGIAMLRPVLDEDGALRDLMFVRVNAAAAEIVCQGCAPAIGRLALRDHFGGDEEAFAPYRRVWETGAAARFEVDRRPAAGVFRVSAVKAGQMVIVTFADITALVEANEALERQRVELTYQYEILDSQAAELAGIAEDIDAARAEARNAERFAADLLEAVPVPVFFKSLVGRRLRMVNQRYADLFGLDRAQVVGRTVHDLLGAPVADAIEARDEALYEGDLQRQVHEADVVFPGIGEPRRMVMHKARMRDADNRLIGITGVIVDVTESHRLRQELERLALTDPLTGLSNRRAFLAEADDAFARVAGEGGTASVVMMDVDHFKAVNDRHGHDVGDLVLQEVAAVLRAAVSPADGLAARYGGEEFVLLLPDATAAAARQIAERLRKAFEAAAVASTGGPVRFTASFGVGQWHGGGDTVQAVLKRADAALYRAKASGRNCVQLAA